LFFSELETMDETSIRYEHFEVSEKAGSVGLSPSIISTGSDLLCAFGFLWTLTDLSVFFIAASESIRRTTRNIVIVIIVCAVVVIGVGAGVGGALAGSGGGGAGPTGGGAAAGNAAVQSAILQSGTVTLASGSSVPAAGSMASIVHVSQVRLVVY
jgi:hypothetical protein